MPSHNLYCTTLLIAIYHFLLSSMTTIVFTLVPSCYPCFAHHKKHLHAIVRRRNITLCPSIIALSHAAISASFPVAAKLTLVVYYAQHTPFLS